MLKKGNSKLLYCNKPTKQSKNRNDHTWWNEHRRIFLCSVLVIQVLMIPYLTCFTDAFTPILSPSSFMTSIPSTSNNYHHTTINKSKNFAFTMNIIPRTRSSNIFQSKSSSILNSTTVSSSSSSTTSNHTITTNHDHQRTNDNTNLNDKTEATLSTSKQQQQHSSDTSNFVQSMSSEDFLQLLNKYMDRIQRSDTTSSSSSIETIRTSMIVETLWKQRYISPAMSSNHNNMTDILSSFHLVLKSWSKTCQILLELHDMNSGLPSKGTSAKIDVKSTFVSDLPNVQVDMSSLQIYTCKDAAIHVTKLFMEMIQLNYIKPDRNTFHIVMELWCKSRDMDAPKQVQQLIQFMEQKCSIHPDTLSYNLYIDTIAFGTIRNNDISTCNDRIELIHTIWDEMELCPTATPNTRTINSILHAYSTVIGKYVTQLNYNQIDARTKLSVEQEVESLLQSVLQIFNNMKDKYAQSKSIYDQPDSMTYSTVMECFARHGTIQSTEQVEALLEEMKQNDVANSNSKRIVQPTAYTYSIVIKAWSRTYHPKAAHRVDELLKECITLCQQPMSTDNNQTQSYNPNKLTSNIFTSVIQTWSRSQEPTKAVRVLQILQDMRSMAESTPTVTPTLLTYNTAIDTCAKTRGTPSQQTAALKIAFAIYKTIDITNNVQPNHITYATLLKAISTLVPQGDVTRNTLSKVVFDKAIQSSQVDRNVIQQLQKSCDTHILHSLLLTPASSSSLVSSDPSNSMVQTNKNGHIDYDKIPLQWSKNVRI